VDFSKFKTFAIRSGRLNGKNPLRRIEPAEGEGGGAFSRGPTFLEVWNGRRERTRDFQLGNIRFD
jgi:hypothetical protein